MRISPTLTRMIDWFYPPFGRLMPLQTFRYAACGGANLVLNWLLYYIMFHYIISKENLDLGFVTISAHIASMLIVFPITFFTGFLLNKKIAFKSSPLRNRVQLFRYIISVAGSVLLSYAILKFFVEAAHIYPTPSQVITSLLVTVYSYLMQKYYTFRGCVDI